MDEIRLPCGLVLTLNEAFVYCQQEPGPVSIGIVTAFHGHPYHEAYLGVNRKFGTRSECESWLNARVEELVASLGAVIVPEDARERIERAIVDRRLALGKDDEGLRHEIGGHPHASWVEKEYASAVLSALGMVRR